MVSTLPPSPKDPTFVQLIRWIFDPLGYMESSRQECGDTFQARIGRNYDQLTFIGDPKLIQELLSDDTNRFNAGKANHLLRILVGDYSLLLLDGDRHQRHRKLLMPPFHGERMKAYGQIMVNIAQSVSDRWQVGKPFEVRLEMQKIALQVILHAVFGLEEGDRAEAIQRELSAVLDSIGSPLSSTLLFFKFLQKDWGPWSPWGRLLRQQQRITEMLYAEIAERQAEDAGDRVDILSLLLAARDEAGEPMTQQEVRDELMTLLLAGHETTASALGWALYWIHRDPAVRDRLLAELASVAGTTDPMAIARLPYLTAVCQETLRLYPIAMIVSPRVTKEPYTLGPYQFRAETPLAPCIYLTHHREDLYPEPKRFRPERFLERQFSPYEYLPFGGSNRLCIGAAFAMFEMKLVLATLLQRYDLKLTSDRDLRPTRRGVTAAPPSQLRMVVTQTRSPQANAEAVAVR